MISPTRPAANSSPGERSERLRRWTDPALTVLAIELTIGIFVVAPLAVVAPRGDGFTLPLLLTVLVVAPVLITAVLVTSVNGVAMGAVFVAIAVVLMGMVFWREGPSIVATYLHLIGALIMGSALIWVISRAVFAPGPVTPHRLVGTVLLYLMLGATFAGLYGTLGLLIPHPFKGMPHRDDGPAVIEHVLYFSFTTLTSTGFGDVVPMHPLTRGLANLESVIGQLFPAVVIARMVTLELASRRRANGGKSN
jgi:Ion channel